MGEQVAEIKKLQKQLKYKFNELGNSLDETTIESGKDYFQQVRDKTTAPFALYYTLHNALIACDAAIIEKPSRELSLVKTKLQEALHWLNEVE